MKTNRLILSLVSTLLASVGLARAAELLDPIARATPVRLAPPSSAAADCSVPCNVPSDVQAA